MRFFRYIALFLFPFTVFAQSGEIAPDFQMQLLNGERTALSNYHGQVVYISFWASWCSPCIKNFMKYKEIRKQLEQEGVILLNVSIDENEQAWLEATKRLNLSGINALSKKEALYPDYPISSIPLYEIISKTGTFLYLSDQPDRNILSQFREWLKE